MSFVVSSRCPQMRIRQDVRSRKNFGKTPGSRLRDTRIPPGKPSFARDYHDARRWCRPKSDAPAAPPDWVGLRPRFTSGALRKTPRYGRIFEWR